MFDLEDAPASVMEVTACRKAYPNRYIQANAYDARLTKQTTALNFIVNRPEVEPGFRLDRTETNDRHVEYTLYFYAADKTHGRRYGGGDTPD